MSLSNAAETAILNLLFNNSNYSNIGDATGLRGSTTAGVFYISLHTSDPGEAGSQNTNETTVGGYSRVSVVRTSSGFTVSGNSATNTAVITFPQVTSGSATLTHFGIGTDATLAGNLLLSGALTASLSVSAGITPSFAIGQLSVTAD